MPLAKIKKDANLRLSLFHSLVKMFDISLRFFLGIYLASIGFTGGQIGTVFAVSMITSILTLLPSGLTNDKLKSKNLITVALILVGIQFLGLSTIHDFSIVVLLFFCGGLGKSIYTTSAESLFHKSSEKKEVSKKISIFQGLTYLTLSTGMFLAGLTLQLDVSFPELFKIVSGCYIFLAIIAQLALPSNARSEFAVLHYKKDIFRKEVFVFLAIMFMFAIHFGAEATSYGLFLENYFNLNKLEIGIYMALGVLAMAPAVIYYSRSKIKPKNILLLGLFMSGLFHILMAVKPVELSLVFRMLHEIGDAAMFFFLFKGVSKLFDLKRIGGNASLFTFVITLGATAGSLIFGPIGATYGYEMAIIGGGITTLAALAIAIPYLHLLDH